MADRRSEDRRRATDPRTVAQAFRERRQAETVQLRKQRKEEHLNRRRQRTIGTTHVVDATAQQKSLESALTRLENDSTSVENLIGFQVCLRENAIGVAAFLGRLLDQEPERCKYLVNVLMKNITHGDNSTQVSSEKALDAALYILMDLSSTSENTRHAAENDYYGRKSLNWSELLLEGHLLDTLLLMFAPGQNHSRVGTISSILGNLVQEEPSMALRRLLREWSTFVKHLPLTSYLCATIVRQDGTHFARDFMKDLTPQRLAQLLTTEQAAEGAWILRGFTEREPDAISVLCREEMLMSSIFHVLDCGSSSALVPVLQALDNIADRRAEQLLANTGFVERLKTRILSVTRDAVLLRNLLYVTGTLLMDAGLPKHPSTTIAAPILLPVVVDGIVSESTVRESKGDLLWVMAMAVGFPRTRTTEVAHEVKECHRAMIQTVIWDPMPAPRAEFFLQAIVDALSNPHDADSATAAVWTLDGMLRNVPASRLLFENVNGGVDALEQVCVRHFEGADVVAADILDDFFENKDDDDVELTAPAMTSDHFVFGSAPPGTPGDNSHLARGSAPPLGRGRGATLPSWMTR